jgi:hypothetical protein
MHVSRLVTKAETRLVPSVSKPQCLVKVYLPALPPGLLGVMDVPLLEGQSVVMRGLGVEVERAIAERIEVVGVGVLDEVGAVDDLFVVSICLEEVQCIFTSARPMVV